MLCRHFVINFTNYFLKPYSISGQDGTTERGICNCTVLMPLVVELFRTRKILGSNAIVSFGWVIGGQTLATPTSATLEKTTSAIPALRG